MAGAPSGPGIPIVRVSMTDRDVVERVGRLLNRAVVPLRPRRRGYKPPYATSLKGTPAVELMRWILPIMSSDRQRQIASAVASWHGKPAVDPRLTSDRATWWLAGLLEGEGHFGISRTASGNYPVIELKMCARDTVARAAVELRPVSIERREPRQPGWKVTYTAKISGNKAAAWMAVLRPFMGVRRTAAIDAALAVYRPIRRGATGALRRRWLRISASLTWSLPHALHELDARCREGTRAADQAAPLAAALRRRRLVVLRLRVTARAAATRAAAARATARAAGVAAARSGGA